MREGDFKIKRIYEPDKAAMIAVLKKVQSLKNPKKPEKDTKEDE